MNIAGNTLTKFNVLEMLYLSGYQSDIIERTINKLIVLASDRLKDEQALLNSRLRYFERQYQMSSDVFYKRYENGELEDSNDFMEWSSFYDMMQIVHKHLESLTGIFQ